MGILDGREIAGNLAAPQNRGDAVMAEAAMNLRQDLTHGSAGHSWEKTGAELTGTMAAGIAGSAVWAIAGRTELGIPLRVISTILASGGARVGVQGGIEHFFVPEKEKSSARELFGWGVVDGAAAVAGSAAEARMANWYTKRLGMGYLGAGISESLAETAGKKAIENSLEAKFKFSVVRGITGGATGGFVWGVPHELYNARTGLDTTAGWQHVADSLVKDTMLGGITGGAFAGTITAATNARDVAGYTLAKLTGDAGQTKMQLLHFNDMHSSLLGTESTLPQLSTKVNDLRADAARKGISSKLFDAGDNFSGTPEAGLSRAGYVETRAINDMGADGFVPGNHVADAGNADVDVTGWYEGIMRIRHELGRDIPGVAANIEVPKYPGFTGPNGTIYRPYRIMEVAGANGQTERVGLVGLVTKELEDAAKDGQIKYLDAETEANRWISHLNKPVSEGGEGINKVIVLSHLGRNEDLALARNVKGISYIVSAHSHDAEPVMLWGKNHQTGWDVPIMQAGSQAKWLAESQLSFKPSGAADKYRTFGQLHRISEDIPHDPKVQSFLEQHLGPMLDLENQKLDASVARPFHIDGARGSAGGQTPLGFLISKAVKDGVNEHLPELNAARAAQGLEPLEPVTIMLKHTGEIREELPAGAPSYRTVAKMFLNTGSVERETRELAIAKLTGSELEKVLNFGVEDFPSPMNTGERGWAKVSGALKQMFQGEPPAQLHDYPGNFLQTDGLKYSIDLSKSPGQRVSNIEILDGATNQYRPVDPNESYRVLTFNHPIEKWNKNGVFGPELQSAGEAGIRAHVDAQSVPLSQVDLTIDYMNKAHILDPSAFNSDNITNLTPPSWRPTVRPTVGTIGGITVDETREK